MRRTLAKHMAKSIGIVMMCLLCIVSLCACNTDENKRVTERENVLYRSEILYEPETLTMCVVVGLNGSEENRLAETAEWISSKYAYNAMFNKEDVDIILDSAALYKEIDSGLTDGQRVHEGLNYNRLKVVLRYDTIYKSIKSDATVTKSGKQYRHSFDLDKTLEEQKLQLQVKTQNSAGWYTILVVSVIAVGVLTVTVIAVARRRKLR